MTVKQSTKRQESKPDKPRDDFPLFAHASGQWAKKFKGKVYYFGKWDDPAAAERLWLEKQDILISSTQRHAPPDNLKHLLQFKTPPQSSNWGLTVGDLCAKSVKSRKRKMDSGELSEHTFFDHRRSADRVKKFFGTNTLVHSLAPERFADFRSSLARGIALKTLEGCMAECRAVFNHADKNGLLEVPLRKLWGTEFDKPTKKRLKKEKRGNGKREFTPGEIKSLLASADHTMKAMILLGLNCGFGNTDVANLKTTDIENGFVELTRSKTEKERRCPLWLETAAAIKVVLDSKKSLDDVDEMFRSLSVLAGERGALMISNLVFVTKYGNSFLPRTRETKNGKAAYIDPVSGKFTKTRTAAKVTGKGKSFYALRHMFQTLGDESRDFVAVRFIMGHDDSSISDNYRGKISDDRLIAVTDTVRDWLIKNGCFAAAE